MRQYESRSFLDGLRRAKWKCQQTFQTPLDDLDRFVNVITTVSPQATTASAIIDNVVFEPRYELPPLFEKHSLPQNWQGTDLVIEAESAAEVRELLRAVLSEWIDFLFVPSPSPFVIYADHDEYTTFLAHCEEHLSGVVAALRVARFSAVDYIREL